MSTCSKRRTQRGETGKGNVFGEAASSRMAVRHSSEHYSAFSIIGLGSDGKGRFRQLNDIANKITEEIAAAGKLLQQHHVTTQRLRKSPELSSTSNAAKSTTHTTSQPQMDSATPQVPFEGQLEDVQWQELADAVTILKRNCPICWMAHSIARPPHPTIADPAHSDIEVVAI